MTTIAQVRESIAAAIIQGTGLDCLPHTVHVVNPPCAHVEVGEFDPRLVLQSTKAVYPFRVRVFCGSLSEIDEARAFDEYREVTGAKSLTAAIQNDDLWTCTVDYAQVVSIGAPGPVDVGGFPYMAVDFDVEVCW